MVFRGRCPARAELDAAVSSSAVGGGRGGGRGRVVPGGEVVGRGVEVVLVGGGAPSRVEDVGGGTELGDEVHVDGPDLDLEGVRGAVEAHEDGGVEALVAVGLWRGDVVLGAIGDGRPGRVNEGERAVAEGLASGDAMARVLVVEGMLPGFEDDSERDGVERVEDVVVVGRSRGESLDEVLAFLETTMPEFPLLAPDGKWFLLASRDAEASRRRS